MPSTTDPLEILLIGNYAPDQQRSMERYAEQIALNVPNTQWRVRLITPTSVFGRLLPRNKWLGYLDKYGIFPMRLWLSTHKLVRPAVVHIADHSNAMYTACCGTVPVIVTVHDLLAVRAALGEDGTACKSSRLGVFQQKWIVAGLRRAQMLAPVSGATLQDVVRVVRPAATPRVIPNAVGAAFKVISASCIREDLSKLTVPQDALPYIFHVGSSLPRKNRITVVRVFERLKSSGWKGRLVFAGSDATVDVGKAIAISPYSADIHFVGKVTEGQLVALYNGAHCLIFPSFSEGFGWPCIEAGACGCPVIAANTTSLPEVCGRGGQVFPPEDIEGMATAICRFDDDRVRTHWAQAAQENAAIYTLTGLAQAYRNAYFALLG
jgi:glycosyltransferase involved in cell wall biosynthesis